jgi:hypothetical protein
MNLSRSVEASEKVIDRNTMIKQGDMMMDRDKMIREGMMK